MQYNIEEKKKNIKIINIIILQTRSIISIENNLEDALFF